MFEKEIDLLRKKVKYHTWFNCLVILLSVILGSLYNEVLHIGLILIIVENTYFHLEALRCPQCKKLLRNPLMPKMFHLPERCRHCDLKI